MSVPEIHTTIRDKTWCRGCGFYPTVNAARHRDDCTAQVLAGTRVGHQRKGKQ